jgi:Zn-dependent M28 family amino/carboxypeptidase
VKRLIVVALVGLAGCGGGDERAAKTTQATPTSTAAAATEKPIDAAGIRQHLQALQDIAERNDGNRAAGTDGDTQTSDYVADQLRAAGWKVSFQTVSFPFFAERGRPELDGLRRGRDFRVLEYSPGADLRARVRPLDTPACEKAALDPVEDGEIVLVARGTCTFRRKAINARAAGAGALVVVDREARGDGPVSATLGRPNGVEIPVLVISADAAARLARSDAPIHLKVDTESEQRETRNVIAETRGTTGDVVMAGAHLDSVEEGPGINDDGSGVAALLEVAERLADRPGLRLGFWAAEELGLYGSRRYVRDLSADERKAISAYVNLDMVGSPKPSPMVYDTDDRIERVLRRAFDGDEEEISLGASSDHAPFESAKIPVGGLFTGATEKTDPCYHRACDTVRSADADMAARMARAAQDALPRLAR